MSPITETCQMHEVCKALGVSNDTVKRLIEAGEFPVPIEVTANGRMWLKADVEWFIYTKAVKTRLKEKLTAGDRRRPPATAELGQDPDDPKT